MFTPQRPQILQMIQCCAIVIIFALALALAPAHAITLEELKGVSIQASATYNMRIRRAEGEFNTQMTMVMKFRIDEEGRIFGENTRTVTTPRGPRSKSLPMKARIGKPGEPAATACGLSTGRSSCCSALLRRGDSRARLSLRPPIRL